MRKTFCRYVICLVAMCGFVRVAGAVGDDSTIYPTDGWVFRAAPILGPQTFSGNIVVNGQNGNFDANLSDIADKVKWDTEARIEAWNGHWGIVSNIAYAGLWGQQSSPSQVNTFSGDLFSWDFLGSYGFGPIPMGNSSLGIELMAGPRIGYYDLDLTLEPGGSYEDNRAWIDPIIGTRLSYNFLEVWRLDVNGSVGGFGVGSGSSQMTRLAGTINWMIDPYIELFAGYQHTDVKTQDQSGSSGSQINGAMFGPVIGITFVIF